MNQDTTPASGAAIKRYKIGYREDEWGKRSSTPGGIPDASGSWVRYADHVTALAAGQATAAQQPAQSSAAADTVVLEAALRAIHQAIDLIGEPDTERLRTVRRVLRGAVVVAEDCKAPQADSQSAPVGQNESAYQRGYMDGMAKGRREAEAYSVLEDALRYRWLREGNDAKHGAAWHVAVNLYGCEWDAAIDAARKQGASHDR